MKVGIIGCGEISHIHIPYIRNYENAAIVGIADINREALERVAKRFGIRDKFLDPDALIEQNEPDVVHILTPPQNHYQLGLKVLEKGCNILMEKPLALDAREAKGLIEAAKKKRLRLCVNHNFKYNSTTLEVKRIVESKILGDICGVESYYGANLGANPKNRYMAEPYRHWAYRMPGGLFQNLLSHPLSVILEFIPFPKEIYSVANETGTLPAGVPDELRILLKGENTLGTLTLSLGGTPPFQYIKIIGTKGIIYADFLNKRIIHYRERSLPRPISRVLMNIEEGLKILTSTTANVTSFLMRKFTPYEGVNELIHRFYRSIEEGSEPPVTEDEGLKVTEVMDIIWRQINYPDFTSLGEKGK